MISQDGYEAMKRMAREIAGRTDTLPDTYAEYVKECEEKKNGNKTTN